MRSILPLILGFLLSAFLAYQAVYYLEQSAYLANLPLLRHISPRWLAVVPALFLLEILRRHYDDLYIFSDIRIQHKSGRLSLNYRVPSVKYCDIRFIRVLQSIWGRLLDYGNVELGTAAQSGVELVLEGIRSPRELADLIEDLRGQAEKLEEIKSADD